MKENQIVIQKFIETLIKYYPDTFEKVMDKIGADPSDILFFLHEVGTPDHLVEVYLDTEQR